MSSGVMWLIIILLAVFLFLCYKGTTVHAPLMDMQGGQ